MRFGFFIPVSAISGHSEFHSLYFTLYLKAILAFLTFIYLHEFYYSQTIINTWKCALKNKLKMDSHSETTLFHAWSGTTCNAIMDHQGAAGHRLKTRDLRENLLTKVFFSKQMCFQPVPKF